MYRGPENQSIKRGSYPHCRTWANGAGSSCCWPHGSNHLTLEHWHLWEHRPTTTAFTTSSLRAYGFLTQLHNINKHVCTQEVKQSNPPGTKCWQGMSKWRGGQVRSAAHHKSRKSAKVKGLKGLNPDLRTSHSKVMHRVCHTLKLKEVVQSGLSVTWLI